MAFAAASSLESLDLGKLLKILQDGMVYNQLSTASEMWKHILQKKTKSDDGRKLAYEIMTAYGPSAVQFTGFSASAMFPGGQKSTLVDAAAIYKDIDLTVEYDLSLEKRSGSNLLSYARPLAHEMEAKGYAAARMLSGAVIGDGSGVIGIVGTPSVSSGKLKLTISKASADAGKSHVGWFQEGDKIKIADPNTGTSAAEKVKINNNTDTISYYLVDSVDVDNDHIIAVPYTSADAAVTVTSVSGTTDPEASDIILRWGITIQDLDAVSTNDYNTLSEAFVGLESLCANDGRKVNGITMSGATAGSRKDLNGALLNSKDFQALMSLLKRRCGAGKYKYSKAFMHDSVLDAMVELANADKQFFNVIDFTTGARKIGHQHGKDFIEFISDEFIPKARVYVMPDEKGPVEFVGRDFEQVKIGGQAEFLKGGSTAGRYAKQGQKFMSASGCLLSRHPAAVGVIEDFIVS
jgi:hypothetical protein